MVSISLTFTTIFLTVFTYGNQKAVNNTERLSITDSVKIEVESLMDADPDSAFILLQHLQKLNSGRKLPEEKVFIHQNLAKYFIAKNNPDSAMNYIKNALQIAKGQKNKLLYFNNLALQAEIFELKQQVDTAITLYKTAINYFEKNEKNAAAGKTYHKLGQLYMYNGDNELAIETFFNAEEKLKGSKQYISLGTLYENIAEINVFLGYEDRAIDYTKKAIEYFKKLDNPVHLAAAYAHIGVSYKVQEKYDTALWYYNKSVEIAKISSADQLLAQNYMNMANAYDLTGERETATEYHQKSIEVCREHDIPYGIYLNYINLAEISLQDEKYDEATVFLNDALELGSEKGYGNRVPLFENLFYAAKKTGQYKKAVEYFEKAYELKDSLYKAQKHKELMDLQTRYETQKKEAEILKLKNQKNKEAKTRIVLIGSLIFGFSVTLFLFFWSRQKRINDRQKNNLLKKENQLKTKQVENIRLEKQLKEQELVYQTLKKANVEQINQSIKEKLVPFNTCLRRKKDQEEFSRVLTEITREVSNDPLSDFEQIFIQMHGGFYEKLLEINRELSSSELQLCALLRMNLPSKEITNILNLSLSTIDQRRHNIRKKLGLSGDQNLVGFLITV